MGDPHGTERVQEILTALVKDRLRRSLERVEAALARWRRGEVGPFEAHAEVLAHVARADGLAAAMSRSGKERTAGLLRAAYDGGLIQREELVQLTGKEPDDIALPDDLDADGSSALRLPPKIDVVKGLLAEGPILIHIDARRPGVSVPTRLATDARLVLRFGYGLTPAIRDLEIGDDALVGTLSFGGVPHRCVLPWSAVYAVVCEADQRGMVWPDDVPPEAMKPPADDAPAAECGPPRGQHLKLVE